MIVVLTTGICFAVVDVTNVGVVVVAMDMCSVVFVTFAGAVVVIAGMDRVAVIGGDVTFVCVACVTVASGFLVVLVLGTGTMRGALTEIFTSLTFTRAKLPTRIAKCAMKASLAMRCFMVMAKALLLTVTTYVSDKTLER